MDRTRFTEQKTGNLVAIKLPQAGDDWAFIPDPLPPSGWQLPDNLIDLSMEAWDCLGTLNGIGLTLPNPHLLLRPLQGREAIQSSKLEGTYTTPEEVLLFEKNPSIPKSENDPANAWREVSNYNSASAAGYKHLDDRPFTLNLIRELHGTLMDEVRGREKTPGEFRTMQVAIGSDYRFIPPPPQRLAELFDALKSISISPWISGRN